MTIQKLKKQRSKGLTELIEKYFSFFSWYISKIKKPSIKEGLIFIKLLGNYPNHATLLKFVAATALEVAAATAFSFCLTSVTGSSAPV